MRDQWVKDAWEQNWHWLYRENPELKMREKHYEGGFKWSATLDALSRSWFYHIVLKKLKKTLNKMWASACGWKWMIYWTWKWNVARYSSGTSKSLDEYTGNNSPCDLQHLNYAETLCQSVWFISCYCLKCKEHLIWSCLTQITPLGSGWGTS